MREYYVPNKLSAGRNVRITACGIGGTTISYWMAGGSQAPIVYTRINQSLAQNVGNVLVLVIIQLGTNDAIAGVSQVTALANIETLVTNYRNPYNIAGATSDRKSTRLNS